MNPRDIIRVTTLLFLIRGATSAISQPRVEEIASEISDRLNKLNNENITTETVAYHLIKYTIRFDRIAGRQKVKAVK